MPNVIFGHFYDWLQHKKVQEVVSHLILKNNSFAAGVNSAPVGSPSLRRLLGFLLTGVTVGHKYEILMRKPWELLACLC
jgi:hypothetical protein